MILPFSTQINGKPTYFVEKIHKCFSLKEIYMKAGLDPTIHYPPNYNYVAKDKLPPKLHTIRNDKNNRWKPGVMIDYFINTRQPNMFRFAPRIPVVSMQEIEIIHCSYAGEKYNMDKGVWIRIDDVVISDFWVNELSVNDGFDSVEEFFEYFKEDYIGKIIHWTDLRY